MSQDGRRSARSLIRPHLNDLPPYGTMESVVAVARELGLDVDKVSKLDGNENPYGASPKVAAALAGFSDYHVYPDAGQAAVREAVGRYVGAEPEQIVLGSGADEMLGGYDCFRGQKMRRLLDRPGLRRVSPILYRRLYKWLGAPEGLVDRMLANHAATPLDEVKARYGGVVPAWREVWQALDIDRDLLLASDGRRVRPLDEPPSGFLELVPEEVAGMHPLDAQLALEMESRLPSWMLVIGDRASMSRGVEARVPFLDHELVELIASMPPSLKMKGFTEKAVLRESLKGLVPDAIRQRQKRPFYTPLQEWFFHPGAPDFVEELLGEAAIRRAGLFAPEVVKQLRQQLETAPRHHLVRMQLEWMLTLVLGTQLLQHLFVENFDPASQGMLRPDRSGAWKM